ncbi:MAG: hypothetical protein AABZ92_00625 [Verrucomicrobiota bacterium]
MKINQINNYNIKSFLLNPLKAVKPLGWAALLTLTSSPLAGHQYPHLLPRKMVEIWSKNENSITSLASLKEIEFTSCSIEEFSESMINFILDVWVRQAPIGERRIRAKEKDHTFPK